MNILLFAGTKNGRELGMTLAQAGYRVHVSSASAYGDSLQEFHKNLTSSYGKLDIAAIEGIIDRYQINYIIDSTHPYASEISKNLLAIERKSRLPLLRFERKKAIPENVGLHFKTIISACDYLKKKRGQVLFTTGINELSNIVRYIDNERIYARILPIKSSLALGKASGINPQRLIAKNPPFSLEDNLRHIQEYDIEFLVTKDSGKEGNIEEKILATQETGIELIVIDRPELEFNQVYYYSHEIINHLKREIGDRQQIK